MGHYDFRPSRVHQAATQLLKAERIASPPPWYNAVGSVPPSQMLVRTQPLQHQPGKSKPQRRKASKMFKPQKMTYEEDHLRKSFFKDHPWELARPRMIIEDDGRDSQRSNWRQIEQPEKGLSGESVVQRQLWLLHNVPGISKAGAYDQARKEFYDLRLREETERRVAKEEALATGGYFGKTAMDIGMELEDKEYENWKMWAEKQVELASQRQAAMYTGFDGLESAGDSEGKEIDAGLEELSEPVPAKGQSVSGGARTRP